MDTSTSRDVYINDALVEQGLALTVQDSPQDEMGLETYGLEGPLPGVRIRVLIKIYGRWEMHW